MHQLLKKAKVKLFWLTAKELDSPEYILYNIHSVINLSKNTIKVFLTIIKDYYNYYQSLSLLESIQD